MALAIGANTAVFSVVHAVLLNPLPYPNPDRIVTLSDVSPSVLSGDRAQQISVPDFDDWQAESTSFTAMSYYSSSRASVMAGPVAEYAVVARVTDGFFRVFSAQPAVGRLFARDEVRDGAAGAAVISDRYAREHFGDPAKAVGQTLRLFTQSVPIVGVMPPAFVYPEDTDVWFPADEARNRARQNRRGNNFLAVGLVRADIGVRQAQTEMTTISERIGARYPDTNKNVRVLITPLQRQIVGD